MVVASAERRQEGGGKEEVIDTLVHARWHRILLLHTITNRGLLISSFRGTLWTGFNLNNNELILGAPAFGCPHALMPRPKQVASGDVG